MAEYIFSSPRFIPIKIIDQLIKDLQSDKNRGIYDVDPEEPIASRVKRFFFGGDPPVIRVGDYWGIGGIASIEFTLALGSTLCKLYNSESPEITEEDLRTTIQENSKELENRDWVINRLKSAGRAENESKRIAVANDIRKVVRDSLKLEQFVYKE